MSRLLLVAAVLLGALVIGAPPASAHAELIQSSPRGDSVVGGKFHGISLLFTGIDNEVMPQVELQGPPGAELEVSPLTRDRQKVVLPIEPLTVPGTYTVTWSALSGDGDGPVAGSFAFDYEPEADHPPGITIAQAGEQSRFDAVAIALLAVGAALLAFLVHRVWFALRMQREDAAVDAAVSTDDVVEESVD